MTEDYKDFLDWATPKLTVDQYQTLCKILYSFKKYRKTDMPAVFAMGKFKDEAVAICGHFPHSLLFENNRNYLLERISLIMSVISDYQIDNVLFVCLLERNYLSMTKNKSTAEIAGIVISYFAELIKSGKLRKHIKIEG